jgi:hypothetical protein
MHEGDYHDGAVAPIGAGGEDGIVMLGSINQPFNLHRFVRERHLLFCQLIVANQIDVMGKTDGPPTNDGLFFSFASCTLFLSHFSLSSF